MIRLQRTKAYDDDAPTAPSGSRASAHVSVGALMTVGKNTQYSAVPRAPAPHQHSSHTRLHARSRICRSAGSPSVRAPGRQSAASPSGRFSLNGRVDCVMLNSIRPLFELMIAVPYESSAPRYPRDAREIRVRYAAIRSHQSHRRPSGAIRGDRWQSEAIRDHQWQSSEAISGNHLRQSTHASARGSSRSARSRPRASSRRGCPSSYAQAGLARRQRRRPRRRLDHPP